MENKEIDIRREQIEDYADFLREQERAKATISKYRHDLFQLQTFLAGSPLDKASLIAWKEHLLAAHTPCSVNSMLAAANGFLSFMGRRDMRVKPLRVQRPIFLDERRELTCDEYIRLVYAAESRGNERLALVMQTICSTGIRVSELRFITADAVYARRAQIANKGKLRTVFLPKGLCRLLTDYLAKQKRTAGAVFVTRTGMPLDRSDIWRGMRALCGAAEVSPEKVYPHNLRHLFARTYYSQSGDISRLADILGHSSIDTTRIYTAESGSIHARQIDRLRLVIL